VVSREALEHRDIVRTVRPQRKDDEQSTLRSYWLPADGNIVQHNVDGALQYEIVSLRECGRRLHDNMTL
jgi:hypothetical protein